MFCIHVHNRYFNLIGIILLSRCSNRVLSRTFFLERGCERGYGLFGSVNVGPDGTWNWKENVWCFVMVQNLSCFPIMSHIQLECSEKPIVRKTKETPPSHFLVQKKTTVHIRWRISHKTLIMIIVINVCVLEAITIFYFCCGLIAIHKATQLTCPHPFVSGQFRRLHDCINFPDHQPWVLLLFEM